MFNFDGCAPNSIKKWVGTNEKWGAPKIFFGALCRNNYYHHCAPPLLKSFRRLCMTVTSCHTVKSILTTGAQSTGTAHFASTASDIHDVVWSHRQVRRNRNQSFTFTHPSPVSKHQTTRRQHVSTQLLANVLSVSGNMPHDQLVLTFRVETFPRILTPNGNMPHVWDRTDCLMVCHHTT